jgi:hypothetical protein
MKDLFIFAACHVFLRLRDTIFAQQQGPRTGECPAPFTNHRQQARAGMDRFMSLCGNRGVEVFLIGRLRGRIVGPFPWAGR